MSHKVYGFREIAELLIVSIEKQEELLHTEREMLHELRRLNKPHLTAFRFQQHTEGVPSMFNQILAGLAPGTSGTVTIQPVDQSGNPFTLPTGIVPVWTRSNDQILVTPAEDGLSASISVDSAAATDATSTITVTVDTVSSTAGFPIDPNPTPPANQLAGFNFAQS